MPRCPFANLPDRTEGVGARASLARKLVTCRCLEPLVVARIEFLEWTLENRLRHARVAGIRSDKDGHDVFRERVSDMRSLKCAYKIRATAIEDLVGGLDPDEEHVRRVV